MEGETPEELYASIFEMALRAPGTGSLLQAGIVGSASEGSYSVLLGLDVRLPGAETNLARTHRGRSTCTVIRYLDVQKGTEDPRV